MSLYSKVMFLIHRL